MSPELPFAVFRGNRPRTVAELAAWHAGARRELALEPDLPIVDAHHHLYGARTDAQHYMADDLARDLASGHRVIGTVYIEAFQSGWRDDGEPVLRSVGEVEKILQESRGATRQVPHACDVAAGIVSNVDMMLGGDAARVVAAHVEAGGGRVRGVRHHATHDQGTIGGFIHNAPAGLLADAQFRRGFACLERFGLSFDAVVFHTQLGELADLADAFPHTRMILDHVGMCIGVAEYAMDPAKHRATWRRGLQQLAARSNVYVKIGGMGMPLFGFGFERARRPATSSELALAWRPLVDTCIDTFGPQRCMFEGNFPIDKQSCSYVALWNAFKRCTLGMAPDERSDLFHRTAIRAYGLPALIKP